MKVLRIICVILCVFVLLFTPVSVCGTGEVTVDTGEADSDAAVVSGTHSVDAAVSYLGTENAVENANAVFLYEASSDTLMYAQNPDMQIFPSSLVKIITALIAVEQGNLADIVTVDEEILAEVPYDAVSADLLAGEQMSLSDLLYCMMVGSANDAASVIAKHISGSQSAFVDEMNRFAMELGCTGTQFTNPHGLHDEQQYSTVRDLTRILNAAMENEQFRTFFSTVHYTVPATNLSEERELSTTNFLMNNDGMEIYYDARVTGGRTGISDDGTRCLAATAESNGLQLLCVLVGAESTFSEDGKTVVYGSFKEASMLFDTAFSGYQSVQILYEGQALRQYTVVNGTSDVVVGSQTSVTTILPEGVGQSDLSFRYSDYHQELQAPVGVGDKLSRVEVWYGNMCVAQADLVAMNSVRAADSVSQADPSQDAGAGALKIILSALLVIVISVFVLFLAVYIVRKINMAAMKNRGSRYRRDRRRSR